MALTIPNRFVNGQTVDAARFNSNSDAISAWANSTDATLAAVAAAAVAGEGVFFAHAAAAQTVTGSSTITRLTLGTEVYDKESWFATNVYTPQREGYYLLFGSVFCSGGVEADRVTLYIRKNSATPNHRATASGEANSLSYATIVSANGTTDYFDLAAFHSFAASTDYYYAQFGGMFVASL